MKILLRFSAVTCQCPFWAVPPPLVQKHALLFCSISRVQSTLYNLDLGNLENLDNLEFRREFGQSWYNLVPLAVQKPFVT